LKLKYLVIDQLKPTTKYKIKEEGASVDKEER
jgi:hypothetical protein